MDSTPLPPDPALDTIYKEGFVSLPDASVEKDVAELERNGFHFWTEEGLDFCIKHVLHQSVCDTLFGVYFLTKCSASDPY